MDVVYVVGSGPAGVACALGLLARNQVRVIMLDVGKQLEPHLLDNRQQRNDSIHYPLQLPPWESGNPKKKFVKHVFGSIYPYDLGDFSHSIAPQNVTLRASFAKGGLSNVWGASLMPFREHDMSDWPIDITELQSYYKKILTHLPLATCFQEDLPDWPLFHANPTEYNLSLQADHLKNHYLIHRKKLNQQGIWVGGSRLAIQHNTDVGGCVYCGECMYGCPKDLVYSTRHTLPVLIKHPLFSYQPGFQVEKISENENSVSLQARNINNNEIVSFVGKKVFLATGVIMSTYLMMKSFPWLSNQELTMQDCQHFALPCLMLRRIKNVSQSPTHALSQLYYEVMKPDLLVESIHLQLYTYSKMIAEECQNKMKLPKKLMHFLRPMIERLTVLQGYLPSRVSGAIRARFNLEKNILSLSDHAQTNTLAVINQLTSLFTKQALNLGFVPLKPLMQITPIGTSNHFGGSFPMRNRTDKINESDELGRPHFLQRVHIVDASIFPSIPAQSITLTVMANSYRIGHISPLN